MSRGQRSPWGGVPRPAPAAPVAPQVLEPSVYRGALRRNTVGGLIWIPIALILGIVALQGWAAHRDSRPATPKGGQVARGKVESEVPYGDTTVYGVRMGNESTVMVPDHGQEPSIGTDVYVAFGANGRPASLTPVTWGGLLVALGVGFLAFLALLCAIFLGPRAVAIRRQFRGGLWPSDARASGTGSSGMGALSASVLATVLYNLILIPFGRVGVAWNSGNRLNGAPPRLGMNHPWRCYLDLESVKGVDQVGRGQVFLPMVDHPTKVRAVYASESNRIVRVRR